MDATGLSDFCKLLWNATVYETQFHRCINDSINMTRVDMAVGNSL